MHTISPATQALLSNTKGLEPIILLEIFWSPYSSVSRLYCDKQIANIDGKIVDCSDLESVINIQKNSTTSTITVVLDDSDGKLKAIFDNNDVHQRKVRVYQWFDGLPLSERILLFIGYISSPVVWSEGDRTIKFDIVTKVEDQEIGFSIEEGDYKGVPDSLIGKPWPLGFGTCVKVPALALNDIPSNVTAQIQAAVGVEDPSLKRQIGLGGANYDALIQLSVYWLTAAGRAAFARDFQSTTDEERSTFDGLYNEWLSQGNNYLKEAGNVDKERLGLTAIRNSQRSFMSPSVTVQKTGNFPEGQNVPVKLNDTDAQGMFNGNNFVFTYIEHPLEPGVNQLEEQPIPTYIVDVNAVQRDRITKLGFHWIDSGTELKWRATSYINYVVNLLPCSIRACYSVKNGKLTRIPDDYILNKDYVNFGTIGAKIVTIGKRMPDGNVVALANTDEGWESDLYVTFRETTVGSNTVDQIRYLIETYTELSVDDTSFNHVRARIDKYGSNFAFLERKQVLTAVQEMAWQARCALWIVDETVYMKYLPEEGTSVSTLTESDIDEGSFEITCSDTEDLCTKLIGTWKPNYFHTTANKLILRYNTAKYGNKEKTFDFYIYNDPLLVLKAASFWIIRYANTWKRLKFRTYVDHIALETFDTVTINMSGHQAGKAAFKALVEANAFNSADNTLTLDLWTPILFGTMEPFIFAWPADISVQVINARTPDPGIVTPNSGSNVDLTPPPNTPTKPGNTSSSQKSGSMSSGGNGPDFKHTNNSDDVVYNDEQNLDGGAGIPQDPTPNYRSSQKPVYQYEYKDFDPDQRAQKSQALQPITAPGQIIGGSGDKYQAVFYPDGISGSGQQINDVKQLQIDGSDIIPPGTWCMITRVVKKGVLDSSRDAWNPKLEYYIQVPVWM
jgi:hypothetical protein